MTVQELIEALNKVEDKSKDVVHYDDLMVEEIDDFEEIRQTIRTFNVVNSDFDLMWIQS